MLRKSARIYHCNTGTAPACSPLILIVCVCLLSLSHPAHAEISWSGDINPDDPTKWTDSTNSYIGNTGTGAIDVNDDSDLYSLKGYIGDKSGSTGEVIVDGAGSTWTISDDFYVGNHGSGTLSITGGAIVSSNTTSPFWYDVAIGNESGSSGSVAVNGADSTWTNNDKSLQIGNYGSGTLSITKGAAVSNGSAYIGDKSGSTGEVMVSGPGSTWTNSGELYVGRRGKGKLSITDGAIASCNVICISGVVVDGHIIDSWAEMTLDGIGSTLNSGSNLQISGGIMSITGGAVCNSYHSRINFYSVVTVDGTDSALNNIGDLYVNSINENGGLIITNGGTVNNSNGYISYAQYPPIHPIPTCKAIVDGAGSSWNNSETLYVGCDTHGSLSITRGAVVSSDSGSIGSYPDSSYSPYTGTVTVDGAGSMWTNSSELKISNGMLSIKDAASVSCKYGYIGCSTTSTGEVTVDGAGSTWTSDVIIVGWKGNGMLSISGGASVSNSVGASIGYLSGSTGEVTVDGAGSTWTNNKLFVGSSGSGTLNVIDGGLVRITETLIIDNNHDGDGFINIATGGMLALYGDGNDSLNDFLGMVEGTDAIRYWDDSTSDWADITGATYGRDYTLEYLTDGDLAGYTVLTVGAVPEPAGVCGLLGLALAGLLGYRRVRGADVR